MDILITDEALKDIEYWKSIEAKEIIKKIKSLLESIQKNPFKGLGKPEPLKGNLKGYWSRRINLEHRLVYRVENNIIIVIQCRFHY